MNVIFVELSINIVVDFDTAHDMLPLPIHDATIVVVFLLVRPAPSFVSLCQACPTYQTPLAPKQISKQKLFAYSKHLQCDCVILVYAPKQVKLDQELLPLSLPSHNFFRVHKK